MSLTISSVMHVLAQDAIGRNVWVPRWEVPNAREVVEPTASPSMRANNLQPLPPPPVNTMLGTNLDILT